MAVAAGLANFALGPDTGGSVRAPAAMCGPVGLEPTCGLATCYALNSGWRVKTGFGVGSDLLENDAIVRTECQPHRLSR